MACTPLKTRLAFLWSWSLNGIHLQSLCVCLQMPKLVFASNVKPLAGLLLPCNDFVLIHPPLKPNSSNSFAPFPCPFPTLPPSIVFSTISSQQMFLFGNSPLPRHVISWMAWTASPLPWTGTHVPYLAWLSLRRTSGAECDALRFSLGIMRLGTNYS